jgi:uncharacterized protein YneF (UPF0154 family)
MNDWVVIAILVIVLLLAMFILPQFMMRRAIKAVLRIFREHHAIGPKNAKAVDELGLQQKGMIQRMMKPRDYKPRALQYLISQEIVQMTEDGKVYLLEEKLDASALRSIQ